MAKKALILLHPGFEELEAVAPIDLLDRAGVTVVQATLADAPGPVTGRSGITLHAGTHLAAVADDTYDAVVLPGGPGILKLRKHPAVTGLLARQSARGGLIACICAAPLLLKDAGLLEGIAYTAHPSTAAELPDAKNDAVVLSGGILTSRGAGTATRFALGLVRELASGEKADEIAAAICTGETPL